MIKKTANFTTFDISRILGVYPTTVANWVDKGSLKAFVTPGGHRRIEARTLSKFLKHHKMPVPPELEKILAKGRTKVLIVEDNIKVLSSIKDCLKRKKGKYEIGIAMDGFEAGRAVSDFKPDVVVLDIRLPGIDGFRVCQLIRESDRNTGIIAMSGFHSDETKKRILAAGANAYLKKPFHMDQLIREIDALTG